MSAMDFSALAARMSAGVAGVRACLILSRDGLSLGVHPADGESRAREAWEALQRVGDPQRGFIDMGTEVWVVASSGAYAAVTVATPDAKPGLLLDRMEAELLTANESRAVPPRVEEREPAAAPPAPRLVDLSAAGAPERAETAPEQRPEPSPRQGTVDRVALAREFGLLLEGKQAGNP